MKPNNIENLLEKYLQGETNLSEENELQDYFSSANVAPELEQHKSLFVNSTVVKQGSFSAKKPLRPRAKDKIRSFADLSIAATIAVLVGIATYMYYRAEVVNPDLGTFDDPEVAFVETQKALSMLSMHVNSGIESVMYVKEYKKTKKLIFKQ